VTDSIRRGIVGEGDGGTTGRAREKIDQTAERPRHFIISLNTTDRDCGSSEATTSDSPSGSL
jgi:hypothetical protein